jgi:hypothetical protein
MIRPLPNGGNWTAQLLQLHAIVPGATIVATSTDQSLNSSYPHRTEDIVVDQATMENIHPGPISWSGAEAPLTHGLVSEVFGDQLGNNGSWDGVLKGVHVLEHTEVGSLGAVRIPVADINLFEDEYNGTKKLRAYLDDAQACYNFPVVAKSLRDAYRHGGLAASNDLLPSRGLVHVRLGLARALAEQAGKCSLMINGIYG